MIVVPDDAFRRGRRSTSIAAKVIVVVVGLTLTLLGAAGSVWFVAFQREQLSDLRSLNEALTKQAGSALALPMWNLDKDQIRKATESILKIPAVEAVVVHAAPKNVQVLRLQRDTLGMPCAVEGSLDPTGLFFSSEQVVYSNEVIGKVEVFVTPRMAQAHLRRIGLILIVFLLVVGLILSGALYLVLWKLAIRPIQLLEQFAQRIDPDSSLSPDFGDARFHGELETLRSSLVGMVSLLDERYVELQERTRRHKASEERFRTLIDTIPDLVWLKDLNGVYLACNKMFERFCGASEIDVVGKTDHDFVSKDLADMFVENDRKAIAAGNASRNEEWVVFADGGEKVLLDTVKTPMRDPDGDLVGVLGVSRDITARFHADEERRILDTRMNNLQKLEALGVLVAGVAHNINNVLAAIMGTASLRGETTRDPEDREAYGVVVLACRRGRDVVKSLMQFSRPTLSSQAPVDLHALLSEVRVLLANTGRSRIEVVESFCETPLWILGDAGGISNSFMNLCLNSMDAMPEGGTITLSTESPEPGWAEIKVRDTGEGMDPERLARVLEPFFTTKEVGKGTGLGLSMTHGVVKAHGGTMRLESVLGQGTDAIIRLPLLTGVHCDPESKADPAPRAPRVLRILLVDDDDDIRLLVTRMLRADGHVVVSAPSGDAALEMLDGSDLPDLVVMDQNMPGRDGVSTMAEMRVRFPALPILISSGQPDIEEWECFRVPGVAVLSKPFDTKELFARIAPFGIHR